MKQNSTQQSEPQPAQQENLDQVEYNKFLAALTPEKIDQLVAKTVELAQQAKAEK
ncbi:MAG: hypothetical protein KA207_02855 [Burkholderiaceae bacterium]|jgi:hypothetical protein|nr:hypothetical protein [Burkholderiaceae bacterium]